MRILLIALAALFFFGTAHESYARKWRHFGVDKAYASREAAIADAPRVLKERSYPEPVIKLLAEAMKKPGREARVVNGEKLDFMRSGPKEIWGNVLVDFDKPPIPGGIEYAVKSEEWSVTWGGEVWTIGIPEICNNSYGRRRKAPVAQAPGCAYVDLVVPWGDNRSVRSTLVRPNELSSFNCWGVIQGPYQVGAPRDCDWCEWSIRAVEEMQARYAGLYRLTHTSIYEVRPDRDGLGRNRLSTVRLVFPLEARTGGIAVCVEVDGKILPAYLILPTSWRGNVYQIPKDFFLKKQIPGTVVR